MNLKAVTRGNESHWRVTVTGVSQAGKRAAAHHSAGKLAPRRGKAGRGGRR